MEYEIIIRDIIEILEIAPRIGKKIDDPEGNRYIQITDTLAKTMIKKLKQFQKSRMIRRYKLSLFAIPPKEPDGRIVDYYEPIITEDLDGEWVKWERESKKSRRPSFLQIDK